MDADTLARARAAIDAARTAAEEEASGYHSGAADDVPALAGAAAALVALAEVMPRLHGIGWMGQTTPWWAVCKLTHWRCIGCDVVFSWDVCHHAPDCAAMAAEAAVARLAGDG